LVSRVDLPPGAVLRLAMKAAGLAARYKAQMLKAVHREMRRWIIVTPAEAGVQEDG
jgi:hypothetical protein